MLFVHAMSFPIPWESGLSPVGAEAKPEVAAASGLTNKTGNATSSSAYGDVIDDAGHDVVGETWHRVRYVTLILYLCTFVVGFAGNTLVLYVIGRYRIVRRKSVANYYIWNLALADELCVLALPLFCWATYM